MSEKSAHLTSINYISASVGGEPACGLIIIISLIHQPPCKPVCVPLYIYEVVVNTVKENTVKVNTVL